MKKYEKPEMNITSYEANDNMMLTASAGMQTSFKDSVEFKSIDF